MKTAKISLAFILPVLLVLSAAFAPLPLAAAPALAESVPPTAATSNTLALGAMNGTTTSYNIYYANYTVYAYAGGNVTELDSMTLSPTGLLVINFSKVVLSGGQVTLYVATNGYADNTGIIGTYLANLTSSEITSNTTTTITVNGATYMLGDDAVIGPAPMVPGGTYWIKAYFGTWSASYTNITILPNIEISPTSGGAGTPITVTGYGFTPNSQANLTWTYNVTGTPAEGFELVTTSSNGEFTTTVSAPELKLETPAPSGSASTTGTVTFQANDTARNILTPTVNFTEYPRQFIEIEEYFPTNASWVPYATLQTPQYNGTLTNVTFYETEPMIIAGNYFDPNSQVTIYFGSQMIGTATTNGTGFFNVTVTVPVVSAGTYAVNATDPLAYIYFSGSPVPEVVVTPNSVTAGQTVTVSGYAFTAGGTANVTWLGQCIGEHNEIYLATNVPIASNGTFSTSVAVPSPVYGGVHYVYVNDTSGVNASALVFVNPSITLSPSTAPLGSTVTVTLNGLMVGQENWTSPISTTNVTLGSGSTESDSYGLAQDNIPTYVSGLTGNNYGYATYELTAAGYPMLHAIELVNETVTPNVLVATAWLNVTGTTNTEAATTSALNQMSSQLTTMGSTLTTMQGSLATLTSEYTNLSTAVGNLGSTLNSDYNSLSSSLGSLSSSVSSGFSSLSSTLSSISSGVSSIQSSLSSMGSTLSSVQAEAAQISSVNSLVLATIVIAIIVLVLEVVVLVRHR